MMQYKYNVKKRGRVAHMTREAIAYEIFWLFDWLGMKQIYQRKRNKDLT